VSGRDQRSLARVRAEVRELERYLDQAPPHAAGREELRERLERARRELARIRARPPSDRDA
jgi:hypothetical protein